MSFFKKTPPVTEHVVHNHYYGEPQMSQHFGQQSFARAEPRRWKPPVNRRLKFPKIKKKDCFKDSYKKVQERQGSIWLCVNPTDSKYGIIELTYESTIYIEKSLVASSTSMLTHYNCFSIENGQRKVKPSITESSFPSEEPSPVFDTEEQDARHVDGKGWVKIPTDVCAEWACHVMNSILNSKITTFHKPWSYGTRPLGNPDNCCKA